MAQLSSLKPRGSTKPTKFSTKNEGAFPCACDVSQGSYREVADKGRRVDLYPPSSEYGGTPPPFAPCLLCGATKGLDAMSHATLSPVRVPVTRQEHSPQQLAGWLANPSQAVKRRARPVFQDLWDSGEFDALEALLRDVRAIMPEITSGPNVRKKVQLKLHRLMQRVTGDKHHGFEHCIFKSAEESVEYIPTPETIRQECEAIQATWTEEERIRRRRAMPGELSGPKAGKEVA